FTNAADRIAHLYRVDLTGAALGALVVLPALTAFNGPMLVPVLATGAVISGTLYARRERARAPFWAGLASFALLAGFIGVEGRYGLLAVTHSHGQREHDVELERWDPVARITVEAVNPDFKWLNIDSEVVTPILRFDRDPKKVAFLGKNVLQLAYRLR